MVNIILNFNNSNTTKMQRKTNKSPIVVPSKRVATEREMTVRRSKKRGELNTYMSKRNQI